MKEYKVIAIIILILACIGFADATYVTINYSLGTVPPCFITTGCETVLTSTWSKIAGIPVSILGMLYYMSLILLSGIFLWKRQERMLKIAAWGSFIGLCMSAWFVSVQAFILNDFCFYCMISAITSTLIFVAGSTYIFRSSKNRTHNVVA